MNTDNTNRTSKYNGRFKALYEDANTWRPHWKDINDYTLPRKGRYLSGNDEKANDGSKKHQKIINGSAKDSARIAAAGMQSGMTSPARPWFVLALQDEELMEYTPVRTWLYTTRQILLNIFSRSNFYSSTHGVYSELVVFATAAMLIEEDFETVIRCRPFTIGEYMLGLNNKNRVDTLYRQYSFTAKQMREFFDEDSLSDAVKMSLKNNKIDDRYEVIHCIQPNDAFNSEKKESKFFPYVDIYFEAKSNEGKFLRESGYKTIPFITPRWDIVAGDTYGGSCPGMDALGDQKMLQKLEEKKLKALDKWVDPPMNGPTALKKKGGNIVSGGVNFYDTQNGGQKFEPAYQTSGDIGAVTQEIRNVEDRIRRFYFNDLFLSILSSDKRMTATEVVERHEEKLLMLGPVIERLQSEMLDKIIQRTFSIAQDFGLIPEQPVEMQGMEVKIEYISLLAQAQKIVGTSSIEQMAAFTGNLTAVYPEARHKFNALEAIDQYADAIGVPPKVINSDDIVKQKIDEEAKAAQAANMQEAMMQSAEGAKLLSETEMDKNSALDAVRGAV